MDKTKIKKFAINARNQLIADVTLKAELIGITNDGIQEPTNATDEIQFFGDYSISGADIRRRQQLVNELKTRSAGKELKDVLPNFIEEVAYTWFNRLIAIRFMEVNHYLPGRIRILSSETPGQDQPDIVKEVLDSDLDFTEAEREQIKIALLNQTVDVMNDLYKMIFIKAANKLNEVLPELFEKLSDYSELLFTPNYTDVNGVIHQLVNDIDEADFDVKRSGQVEIIGWLYQYYNTEPKELSFKKSKYNEADIPAVTQLFTPDWIVKYLVENSLGRYWIDKLHADGDTRSEREISVSFGWKYYMPSTQQIDSVQVRLNNENKNLNELSIEDIKFIDPAMGSGHILVYAYDVFMQIYNSLGYSTRDAAKLIVQKNIYGLDIDTRAFQLSYFAIMMKLRENDRQALLRAIKPNVYDIPDSSSIETEVLETQIESVGVADREQLKNDLKTLINSFKYGNEYGSLIYFDQQLDWQGLKLLTNPRIAEGQASIETIDLPVYQLKLAQLIETGIALSRTYNISVTNPPYMGSGKMDSILSKYVKKEFPNSKSDLFGVFIERLNRFTSSWGYYAMITQHSWMFLSSFEQLRNIMTKNIFINLAHLGTRAFEEIGGEVVQTVAFVIRKSSINDYTGTYERLVDFDSQQKKDKAFKEAVQNPDLDYLYHSNQANFKKIPGSPIAYWASEKLLYDFEIGTKMSSIVDARHGVTTGDNSMFIRLWFEVSIIKTYFNAISRRAAYESKKKWFPYNKGGAYRKWYGNYDYLVNWENDGRLLQTYQRPSDGKVHSITPSKDFYFREAITWSLITSGGFSIRYRNPGSINDVSGMSAFADSHNQLISILGLMNSPIGNYIFKMVNPTINLQIGDFNGFPINRQIFQNDIAIALTKKLIMLSKDDWDSFETSWDFIKHPLLEKIADHNRNWTVEEAYADWAQEVQDRRDQLKSNEEELNRIFIDLYGLQDELTPEVADKDLSVQIVDQERDIKSFLSYFIGVVFGRYSLDQDGLAYAGGDFDFSKYHSFMPNQDDVIVLTNQDYFGDQRDIINRFKSFLTVTFGESHLNDNLTFIAEVLGGKGTPEEVIRNYFFKDFWKDHVKTYKKRPIYWLLDSGRNGGFRALVYLHRYDEDTMAMIRTKYVQELQMSYDSRLGTLTNLIDNATDSKAKNGYIKQRDKLNLQLDELITFETKIAYLANKRITLDLDDGVVVNYQKVQTTDEGKNLGVFKKI